mmetsp:Transcript_1451/g.1534  ORF Transcript_1451/g.1534 Transcript_1451/m.1534 type:complete len:81 (+) Transcript_1451:256-498(+)
MLELSYSLSKTKENPNSRERDRENYHFYLCFGALWLLLLFSPLLLCISFSIFPPNFLTVFLGIFLVKLFSLSSEIFFVVI